MNGFSLLEVCIALFLISICLIKLMPLQLKINDSLQQNYFYSLAHYQLISLNERFQVNKDSSFRTQEIEDWNHENSILLPQGRGEVNCHQSHCVFKITWKFKTRQSLVLECNL